MRMKASSSNCWMLFLYVVFAFVTCVNGQCQPPIAVIDPDILRFAMNFQHLEGEFFMQGSMGKGLDSLYPQLAFGGPPPIGAQKANLDPIVTKISEEFGYQEFGNLRVAIEEVGGRGIMRPLLNLSKEVFSNMVDKAFGFKLNPQFDPYANTTNFLISALFFPYTGQHGLVGAAPSLLLRGSRKLATELLAIEAGQSAVIRTLLYQRANETVTPYNITVNEFVDRISVLLNQIGKCGTKYEGLMVPRSLGAENRTESNILPADPDSLSFSQTPREILRVVYGTGSETKPGGVFPQGANGFLARSYLQGF